MKKLIIFIFLSISFLFGNNVLAGTCSDLKLDNGDLSGFLTDCQPDTVSDFGDDYKLESGLGTASKKVLARVSTVVGLIGVFMIVVAGFMMQFSGGDDSKVKKAKDLIKWTLIGVLVIIGASSIVYIVINLMYSFAG